MNKLFRLEMTRKMEGFASKNQCLEHMVKILYEHDVLAYTDTFIKAVKSREEAMSTGIGRGVAIPHARDHSVNKLGIAVCLLNEGLDFGSVDSEPAHLIFMIAVPHNSNIHYMQVLRHLSEYLRQEDKRLAMMHAKNDEELYQNVQQMESIILAALSGLDSTTPGSK
jgi:fructose-specific phosphotransferase system IIA component